MREEQKKEINPNERKLSNIDIVRRGLYQKKPRTHNRKQKILRKKEYNISNAWNDNSKKTDTQSNTGDTQFDANNGKLIAVATKTKPKKLDFFWVILIFSVIFFLGAVGYASYIFISGGQVISADDIEISIVGPVSVGGGKKVSIDVVLQNNSAIGLKSADLIIDYPDGTKRSDLLTDLRRERITIGDINSGAVHKETINLALFGENNDHKEITVHLEYLVPGSDSYFNEYKSFDIVLSAAPVTILVDALNRVSSGQEMDLEVKIVSNSEEDLNNLMVSINYPFGFVYGSADIEPTYGDNVWVFDKMYPNDEKIIKIKGSINAQDNEVRAFRFEAGIPNEEDEQKIGIIFTNLAHKVSIEKPFLDLMMTINQSDDYEIVIPSGERFISEIIFINNTNNIVRDVEVKVHLSGDALNKNDVVAESGFYSSASNVVVFNKRTSPSLEEVLPMKRVKLNLRLGIKELAKGFEFVNNPEINISAEVTGRRVSESGSEESVKETEIKKVVVLSDVLVTPVTLHSTGAFANTGPIPPKVDQSTTYTILWAISNNSNSLENARVTAILPNYVSWNNLVSPSGDYISYDQHSRQIIWEVGDVPSGAGFTGDTREVQFQVTLQSSVSQLDTAPKLLLNSNLSALDTFTQTEINLPIEDVTTSLQDQSDSFGKYKNVVQ